MINWRREYRPILECGRGGAGGAKIPCRISLWRVIPTLFDWPSPRLGRSVPKLVDSRFLRCAAIGTLYGTLVSPGGVGAALECE